MPAYVILCRFTESGAREVKSTVARAREAIAAVEKSGGKLTVYWTQGQYDLVCFAEGSEELATIMSLAQAKSGSIRVETLRAFSIDEMERLLKKVP